MPSATLQAVLQRPPVLPRNLTDASAIDDWYKALPSTAQRSLDQRLLAIVRAAPAPLRLALQRDMAYSSPADPIPMSLDGMGTYHHTTVRGTRQFLSGGLGWVGPLISTVISTGAQVGAGLYTARESRDLAKDLQSNALRNDRAIAEATLTMQRETELAMIAAQQQAAAIAGTASIGRAQAYAPVLASSMKWVGIAVAAVAIVGGGAWFVTRKKRK